MRSAIDAQRENAREQTVFAARAVDSVAGTVFDVAVIGGGSAGLAAAAAVAESGPCSVVVFEREEYLGGVLPQCVHDGFGLYLYGESLTGPEYAQRWASRVANDGVQIALASTVLSVSRLAEGHTDVRGVAAARCDDSDAMGSAARSIAFAASSPCTPDLFAVDAIGVALGGRATVYARSIVCATGCRERTRGAMQIPGGRPAGVLTAGTAQYMVNVANQMPGDKVVVLGSGDIGLIMARRMTLEGAEVRLVLGQEATGLVRNHIRCIEDFEIPLRYGWGLASIHGYGQLQGVTVAPLREDGSFDMSRKEYIRCNVLLIACGLVPEREILDEAGFAADEPGLFLCGNASMPHDLVDQVTQEGICAGYDAAAYAAAITGGDAPVLPDDLAAITKLSISEPKGRMSDIEKDVVGAMRRIVCTVCPTGCVMKVSESGEVRGNTCSRGAEFASREIACPTRMYTGTVIVEQGARCSLLPVRTAHPVAKAKLIDVARACARLTARAPIHVGDAVCSDIAHTGVALLATSSCERAEG